MTKLNHIAPRAFTLLLALAATLLPLKTTNVFAVGDTADAASPPTCKEGYEYVEAVGKCYKACAEGWERNAETLRCRKIRVEEEEEAAASTTDSTDAPATPSGASATSDATTKASSSGTTSTSASTKSSSAKSGASSASTSTSTRAATPADYADESVPECKSGYEYVEAAGKCYKACTEEQERNPETLRCRKKTSTSTSASSSSSSPSSSSASASASPVADYADESTPTCKAGYEYVASADKCYKACTAEQERNPETNRCRKKTAAGSASSATGSSSSAISDATTCKEGYEYVASAWKCYKACTDDQERNPETNRCKKKQDNTGADYDVDVPETGGSSAFVATGAVVALVLAGVGFVAFQYRTELKKFFQKRFKKA